MVLAGTVGVILLAHLAYWMYAFHFHVLQGDDYYNATVSGHPYGRLSFSEWIASYVYDYTSLNGRFADTLVRALLAPGPWFWQVVGPLLFTAVVTLVWLWGLSASSGVRRWASGRSVALLVGSATLFPVMIATKLAVAGDVLFWMSATVSYVFTVFFALIGGFVLMRVASGRKVGVPLLVVGSLAIVVTHLMHEQGSVGMAALVIATWIVTRRGHRGPALWVCTAASVAGLVAQAVAPGYWLRLTEFNSPETAQSGNRLAQLANGTQALVDTGWSFVLMVSFFVVAAAWSRRRDTLVIIGGCLALTGGIGSWLISRHRLTRSTLRVMTTNEPFANDRIAMVAAIAVGLLVLCVVGLLIVTIAGRDVLGPIPAMAVLAAMGGGAIPWVIGLLSFRAYLPTNVWLAVAVVASAHVLLTPIPRPQTETRPESADATVKADAAAAAKAGEAAAEPAGTPAAETPAATVKAKGKSSLRKIFAKMPSVPGVHPVALWLVAGTLVLAIASSAWPAALTIRATQANAATWEKTAHQIDEAKAGRCKQIAMPARWPTPAYLYSNGIQSPRYADKIHRYYDLPKDVKLVYGGKPADCARR
ncbi:hypothetical protein AUCHE_09_00680 [Austwickia chelonae NBRC 105200]|uniref:Glycosyltransferase RgtA/B/C/D-like domain-containing protein n=2 Tax=Austwickia TaxID=1184606 RepID=K6V8B4_9MICO|nr:hypothetical protein AUCHE_09_00680 [Austwickia chelonae NBRC 105200]